MKITFLGTGTSQGVPIIGCKCRVCDSLNPKDKRLRSSVMIEVAAPAAMSLKGVNSPASQRKNIDSLLQGSGVKRFVIDTGPDFRQQMLRERVDRINAVIYTHDHRDHVAGLDDIRAFNFIMKKKINLYASETVQEGIKNQFGYIFNENQYPGIPEINLHTIENKPFTIEGVTFTPILVKHMHLDVFGFRIGNFTYITDANSISETEKKKIIGSEVLVLNALRNEAHPSHFTLDEAVAQINELKPKTAYLIHMSHQIGLHEEVEDELPENIHLAFDGLHINM
ncbi:MAG: MBL fold metallo-hydrolase [Bacteroidetes bacterium]|nr:MAG: MBL fold metallo-hydrolase [Bacteroidota bacterium]